MPVLKRNHRAIAAAKADPNKRVRYRIEGVAGLWLDVSPSGRRTWYARYQRQIGKSRSFRWYRIGDANAISLGQATGRAREIIADVLIKGSDPHQDRIDRKFAASTFKDLFEAWYDRHALPRLARAGLDRCVYNCHLRNGFAQTAIEELRRTDVGLLRDQIARASGPAASNNALSLINRVLNWAVDEGLIEYNPAARLRKAHASRPRERVLSPDEISRFWAALERMDGMTGEHISRGEPGRMLSFATRSILRLMLLTGQRRGEISQALKSEFDLEFETRSGPSLAREQRIVSFIACLCARWLLNSFAWRFRLALRRPSTSSPPRPDPTCQSEQAQSPAPWPGSRKNSALPAPPHTTLGVPSEQKWPNLVSPPTSARSSSIIARAIAQ